MKVGNRVVFVKDVHHDGGVISIGTEGTVSNIAETWDKTYALVLVEEDMKVYVVDIASVKRIK